MIDVRHPTPLGPMRALLRGLLATNPRGLSRRELARRSVGTETATFNYALVELLQSGEVRLELGPGYELLGSDIRVAMDRLVFVG